MERLRAVSVEPPGAVRDVTPRRVTEHLIHDERILVSTRHHPVVAVWPMPASLTLLILVAAATAKLSVGNPLVDVLWWGWFASVGYAGWKLLDWNNEIFVVTDRRVMLFAGFLTRRVAMMPLVKVTDLTYRRTVGGRIMRYGDFVIESAGQDQALHLVRFLPNPDELYHDIAGTLFGRGGGRAGEPRTRKAASAAPARGDPGGDEEPVQAPDEPWRKWRDQFTGDRTTASGSARAREAAPTSDQPEPPEDPDFDDTATLDAIDD